MATTPDTPSDEAKVIWRLLRHLGQHFRWRTASALVLSVAVGLTEGVGLLLLLPLLALAGLETSELGTIGASLQSVLDAVGWTPSLPSLLGAFVVALGTRAGLLWAQRHHDEALLIDLSNQLRRTLVDAWSAASWPLLARIHPANLARVLILEVDRTYVAAAQGLKIVSDAVLATLYVAIAASLSVPVTVLALVTGGLLLLLLRPLVRSGQRLGQENTTVNTLLHEGLDDLARGSRSIRILGAETRMERDFDRRLDRARNAHLAVIGANARLSFAFSLGTAFIVAAYVWLSLGVLDLDVGVILILLVVFSRLLPRFARLQTSLQDLWVQADGFREVTRLLDTLRSSSPRGTLGTAPLPFEDALVLTDIDYAYPDSNGLALQGVSLEIPKGQTVAIVGPSGQGKSTLADIVAGLLVPDAGRLAIDGIPLDDENVGSWRAGLGYVEQDSYLFHGTLRDNFRRVAPEASDDDIAEALRAAHAEDVVSEQPEGLDTLHGERGVTLSGGEQQRLALAMALARDPDILLLDEATRSVDPPTARRIRQTLREQHGQRTILWITHDLSAVRNADAIHVMEAGRIVQSGTWDDLTTRDGPFRTLLGA